MFDTDSYVFATSGIGGISSSKYEVSADRTLFVSPTNLFKGDLKVLNPKAGAKVSAQNLELKWESYANAAYYKFSIYPEDSSITSPYINERVEGTSFGVDKPLKELTVGKLRLTTARIKSCQKTVGTPLVELYFDVVLHNDRTAPRWFLLPSNLGPESTSVGAKGCIDMLEVFTPHGKGRAIIGHFLGPGGFHALLLPAHAEVRLRMFPISYWGELPDHLAIEVATAKRLTIGGEDARIWFKVNPTSSVKADVAEIATSSMRMVRSRHTPDRKEVASLIEEDKRFEVKVPLGRK